MTRSRQVPIRSFDEDDDENSHSLSPSDGYFNGGGHVPSNVYVEDPSQRQSIRKAQEAMGRPESQYPESNRPNPIYTPSSSSHAAEESFEHSPLLEEAPPGYEAAMADNRPITPSTPSASANGQGPTGQRTGYNSINVGEPNIFDYQGSPRSMVDRRQVRQDEGDPLRRKRRGCCGRTPDRERSRANFRRMLMFVIGLVLITWLIGGLIHKVHNFNHKNDLSAIPVKNDTDAARHPRELRIHESSHSVHGVYPLRDLLEITTSSGSINIVVDPKEADPAHPDEPARLIIHSKSGSVRVEWPSSMSTPDRVYMTSVTTTSGSISGSYVHGVNTELVSESGSITPEIWPFFPDGEQPSQLRTLSQSGSQTVRVLSPAFGKAVKNITAEHISKGSGSLRVTYPPSWEGEARAISGGSGSVSMDGEGLEVERRGARDIVGYKGDGDSHIFVSSRGSGSVRFGLSFLGIGGEKKKSKWF